MPSEAPPSPHPANWLRLPVIATVARLLCRELTLQLRTVRALLCACSALSIPHMVAAAPPPAPLELKTRVGTVKELRLDRAVARPGDRPQPWDGCPFQSQLGNRGSRMTHG